MSRRQAFQNFDISIMCQTLLLLMLLVVYTTAEVPPRTSDNMIMCDYDNDLPPIISVFKDKYTERFNLFPCQYVKPIEKTKSWVDTLQTIESYYNGNDRDNVSLTDTETSNQTEEKRSMPFHLPLQQNGYFVRGISMFGTRNPIVEGYKRGPGFRSWGGKRTMTTREEPENAMKRTRFLSWGNKRNYKNDNLNS